MNFNKPKHTPRSNPETVSNPCGIDSYAPQLRFDRLKSLATSKIVKAAILGAFLVGPNLAQVKSVQAGSSENDGMQYAGMVWTIPGQKGSMDYFYKLNVYDHLNAEDKATVRQMMKQQQNRGLWGTKNPFFIDPGYSSSLRKSVLDLQSRTTMKDGKLSYKHHYAHTAQANTTKISKEDMHWRKGLHGQDGIADVNILGEKFIYSEGLYMIGTKQGYMGSEFKKNVFDRLTQADKMLMIRFMKKGSQLLDNNSPYGRGNVGNNYLTGIHYMDFNKYFSEEDNKLDSDFCKRTVYIMGKIFYKNQKGLVRDTQGHYHVRD